MELTIPIAPVSKKNSQQIVKAGGRYLIVPSAAYKRYEKAAIAVVRDFKACEGFDAPIDGPHEVRCLFYMPTRRKCDLPNMLNAIDDVLVRGGLLSDDNCGVIESHDGSRVLYDKENPRTEIRIEKIVSVTSID